MKMKEEILKAHATLPTKDLQEKFLLPLIAAQLTSAFYSALSLKQISGLDIGNPEIWKEARAEVLNYSFAFENDLRQHYQLPPLK